MPWTRFEALLKDTKTLALAPGWLFQTSTQAGWEFCLEDLMAWYWQFHLQVKYLNFLNLNTFVGCIGLPINFILMEKMSQSSHLTWSKNHLLAGLGGVVVPAHRDDAAVLHQHLLEDLHLLGGPSHATSRS